MNAVFHATVLQFGRFSVSGDSPLTSTDMSGQFVSVGFLLLVRYDVNDTEIKEAPRR